MPNSSVAYEDEPSSSSTATRDKQSRFTPLEMGDGSDEEDDDYKRADIPASEEVSGVSFFHNLLPSTNSSNPTSLDYPLHHLDPQQRHKYQQIVASLHPDDEEDDYDDEEFRRSDDYDRQDSMLDGVHVFARRRFLLDISWSEFLQLQHCNWVLVGAIVLLTVLAAAVLLVPGRPSDASSEYNPPPTGEVSPSDTNQGDTASSGAEDNNSAVYAKTCRSKLFPQSHSWIEFVQTVHTGDPQQVWCETEEKGRLCQCTDRTEPAESALPMWNHAWSQQLAALESAHDSSIPQSTKKSYQVALLGSDLIERWNGESFGRMESSLRDNAHAFSTTFANLSVAPPLAISRDECPQILYRLQNGLLQEISHLQPTVWWLVLGRSDLLHLENNCSVQAIAAGIIQISATLLSERPKATIILNSIVPFYSVEQNAFLHNQAQSLNQALECYAAGQYGRVIFANVTDLFVLPQHLRDASNWLNDTLYEDPVDTQLASQFWPNALGYQVWGDWMVETVIRPILGK